MSQCRVCETHAVNDDVESGPTSVILLRAWRESDGVRCRFVAVAGTVPLTTTVAQGEEAVVAAVSAWLNTL